MCNVTFPNVVFLVFFILSLMTLVFKYALLKWYSFPLLALSVSGAHVSLSFHWKWSDLKSWSVRRWWYRIRAACSSWVEELDL